MSDHVLIAADDRAITITFNRPERRNALSHDAYAAVADALADADAREDVRAVVITGAGEAFTSGNDIADFMQPYPHGEPPVMRFLAAIRDAETPLFCAVNGAAVGVGLTMLLHADFAFASKTATFKAPFAALGLVPEAASSMLLPERVGHAMANDILIAGRTLNAEEALRCGLVSRVLAPDALMAETMAVARSVASLAPNAVKRSRALIRGDRAAIAARMAEENALFAEQLASPEFAESAAAFMQKRAPNFG
ncbi:MAG: enoyl-CoA hydratase-related protein [Pseudomonadota bacterium]